MRGTVISCVIALVIFGYVLRGLQNDVKVLVWGMTRCAVAIHDLQESEDLDDSPVENAYYNDI